MLGTTTFLYRGIIERLQWLGNISYELYVVHYVLLSMLNGLSTNLYMATVLGGGLLLSTILWKTDKRLINRITH